MANHKSALKRHRQSLKRRDRNRIVKTRVKNSVKAVRQAIEAGDGETAAKVLGQANAVLDKAASKNIIHWRNAGRRMARLAKAVQAMSA